MKTFIIVICTMITAVVLLIASVFFAIKITDRKEAVIKEAQYQWQMNDMPSWSTQSIMNGKYHRIAYSPDGTWYVTTEIFSDTDDVHKIPEAWSLVVQKHIETGNSIVAVWRAINNDTIEVFCWDTVDHVYGITREYR